MTTTHAEAATVPAYSDLPNTAEVRYLLGAHRELVEALPLLPGTLVEARAAVEARAGDMAARLHALAATEADRRNGPRRVTPGRLA